MLFNCYALCKVALTFNHLSHSGKEKLQDTAENGSDLIHSPFFKKGQL